MPNDLPPKGVTAQPRFTELAAGSFLWHVTRQPGPGAGGPVSPFQTMPGPADYDPRKSGRFDPTPECAYPYCYAALDDVTALCEVLLRDVGFSAPQRYLPRSQVDGRRLALLETRAPIWLVSLTDAAELAAACQDSWLVHTEAPDYRMTQRWAHWLRDSSAPDGHPPGGLIWPAKRQPGGRALLLFGDRCGSAVIRSSFGERLLYDDNGLDWLNLRLKLLRTKVRK
jgi:RES domain